MSYFETQLQVLETREMTTVEMSRWFSQTLDNVRARHRKLLRFGRCVSSPLFDIVELTFSLPQVHAAPLRELG